MHTKTGARPRLQDSAGCVPTACPALLPPVVDTAPLLHHLILSPDLPVRPCLPCNPCVAARLQLAPPLAPALRPLAVGSCVPPSGAPAPFPAARPSPSPSAPRRCLQTRPPALQVRPRCQPLVQRSCVAMTHFMQRTPCDDQGALPSATSKAPLPAVQCRDGGSGMRAQEAV